MRQEPCGLEQLRATVMQGEPAVQLYPGRVMPRSRKRKQEHEGHDDFDKVVLRMLPSKPTVARSRGRGRGRGRHAHAAGELEEHIGPM